MSMILLEPANTIFQLTVEIKRRTISLVAFSATSLQLLPITPFFCDYASMERITGDKPTCLYKSDPDESS
jgi:hypothetical protein